MNKKTNYKKDGNLNDLTDQDDATELIVNYHKYSNPPDGKFKRYWSNGNKRYEWKLPIPKTYERCFSPRELKNILSTLRESKI